MSIKNLEDDTRNHFVTSSSIHGVTGDIVGTSDAQILTGKTIAAGSNTITGLTASDVGLEDVQNLKVNLSATSAPIFSNDTGEGYVVGSRWFDITNNKEYVCLDNSVGVAVWVETTVGAMTTEGFILNGAADPTTEGQNKDYFHNTTTNVLFGPKASGTWPTIGFPLTPKTAWLRLNGNTTATPQAAINEWGIPITTGGTIVQNTPDITYFEFDATTTAIFPVIPLVDALSSVKINLGGNYKIEVVYELSVTANGGSDFRQIEFGVRRHNDFENDTMIPGGGGSPDELLTTSTQEVSDVHRVSSSRVIIATLVANDYISFHFRNIIDARDPILNAFNVVVTYLGQ